MKIISIGTGHTIVADRIISVIQYGSRPTKRLREEADKVNKAINVANGEAVKTLIITEEGYIFLSSFSHETITKRLEKALEDIAE